MVRFKVKLLACPVYLCAGDRFNLSYTETYPWATKTRLLHSEEITKSCEYACFAVLDLPVGMGMVLGKDIDELRGFLNATWPGCECGEDDGIL